jgi:branched-subunit amino acid transport protein
MKNYLPLILGMLAVTYIPRLLPLVTLAKRPLPNYLRRFLLYIPYTALSALIVRGIIQSPPKQLIPTLTAILVAALTSWFKGSLVISVLASILTSFLLIQAFGG